MKVLYCCDGSTVSINAISNFKLFVQKAQVDIFCVIDWVFLNTCINCPNIDMDSNCKKIAQNIIDDAAHETQKEGFKVNMAEQVYGNASEKISEKIKAGNYDLILMGSHGKKGIKNWLGSVTSNVVKRSGTPIFISKHHQTSNKTLLCVDNSEQNDKAVEFFAKNFNTDNIGICSIIEDEELYADMFYFDDNFIEKIHEEEKKNAQHAILRTKKILEKYNKKVNGEFILTGNVTEEILSLAERENYKFAVLGKNRKSLLDRIFVGSVSKRVMDHFKDSLLIAPSKEKED